MAESSSVVVEASLVSSNLVLPYSTLERSSSSVAGATGELSPPLNLVGGIVSGCLSLGDGQDQLEVVGRGQFRHRLLQWTAVKG